MVDEFDLLSPARVSASGMGEMVLNKQCSVFLSLVFWEMITEWRVAK